MSLLDSIRDLFLITSSVGVLTMIVPLYQAELAHPDIRGLVTGLQQFMLGIGGVCGSVSAQFPD